MGELETRLTEVERLTPKKGGGYNVVGVDDYEIPGEALFLVGNYPTEEAANKVAAARSKGGGTFYVYCPEE